MPEYIRVDQMWKCETCFHHRSGKCTLGMFGCDHGESYRPAYSKLKKVDVAPVAYGEWRTAYTNKENKTTGVECSECGAFYELSLFDFGLMYNYCPSCGARMDG